MRDQSHQQHSTHLKEWKEQHEIDTEEMAHAEKHESPVDSSLPHDLDAGVQEQEETSESDLTLTDVLYNCSNNAKPDRLGDNTFKQCVCSGYNTDKLLSLVIEKPKDYLMFMVRDNLIWRKNLRGNEVLCLPRDHKLLLEILVQAHETVGHFGNQCTDEHIQWWYWWPYATKDVREFCATCNTCQWLKPSNKLPAEKHHLLPIPTKPWDSIRMDFIGPFPESKGFNYLWVVICPMMSMVHLIPIHTTTTATELSWIS